MAMDKEAKAGLYRLTDGSSIIARGGYGSPREEYLSAFAGGDRPFLTFYSVDGGRIKSQQFTRGDFLSLARLGAARLAGEGLKKNDHVVHCFSDNSPYDLILRLAETLTGTVPVTINWQADTDERIIHKVLQSRAKMIVTDEGFSQRLEALNPSLGHPAILPVPALFEEKAATSWESPSLTYADEKGIIFTSGTTGLPKGVVLSHRSYLANRLTFEDYFRLGPATPIDLLLVNPLHHTNSSALADWGMRRGNAVIHLVQRYSTLFWKLLAERAGERRGLLITSLVPRHFDFLMGLKDESRLPLDEDRLRGALSKTEILIGSAPVGPGTIDAVRTFGGGIPWVRFGSTETCLQVMAIPRTMSGETVMAACEAGWAHRFSSAHLPGYYIGREHYPYTRVRIVQAVDRGESGYMKACEEGEPGYMITQGANVMTGYVGQPEETAAVFHEGWYTGLRDMGFFLTGDDGQKDFYWVGRDSALLIRGGANYAYEQVAADLSRVFSEEYHVPMDQFTLAVVGLRLRSEHEDSCIVTIELKEDLALDRHRLAGDFLARAATRVPKGCRPDYVRFGEVPRSFKGAVLYPQLKEACAEHLRSLDEGGTVTRS